MNDRPNRTTYADAGVDIEAGNALVERIKPAVASTDRPGVSGSIGAFGGLFDLRAAGYEDPILVAATDGVGTKLRIAIETNAVETVGIDLVAMCVNDLICQGAEPLFFLDYFATGKLSVDQGSAVIEGVAAGCRDAACALIGGETAEMPGIYADGDFDLAGFAIGALERGTALPDPAEPGDIVLGLASDGIHSNGYSLVRRIVENAGLSWDAPVPFGRGGQAQDLGTALLTPTRIYVRPLLPLIRAGKIRALAHITGGGLIENVPRALPKQRGALIDLHSWELPPVFRWLMAESGLDQHEALRTFNCGIGMAVIVEPGAAELVTETLTDAGETVFQIGSVQEQAGLRVEGSFA